MIFNENRLKKLSYADAIAYSLMVGLGETFIIGFALELGMNSKIAGLLTVVPVVCGAFFQLFSIYLFHHRLSARFWTMCCGYIQSISLLGLACIGIISHKPIQPTEQILLFFIASIYWSSALAAGPIWNGWISELLAPSSRGAFFLRRNYYAQAAIIVSLAIATLTFKYAESRNLVRYALVGLLIVAACCRLFSTHLLSLHPKDTTVSLPNQRLKNEPIWQWLRNRQVLIMLFFCFSTNFSVHVSAPYFGPYLLRNLQLSYDDYTILIGAAFFARVVTNGFIAKLNQRFGAKFVLMIGALGIIPVAGLYTLTPNFYFILVLQLFSGLVWSCHELGITLYLLESMDRSKRSRLLSWVSLFNSLGMLAGVALALSIIQQTPIPKSTYFDLFHYSSMLRVLPFLIFIVWAPKAIHDQSLIMRIMGLRAHGHAIIRPILIKTTKHAQWVSSIKRKKKKR